MTRSKSPAAGKKPTGTPPPPATRSKAPAVVAASPVTLVKTKVLVILLYVFVGVAANSGQGLKYEMYLANHVSACAVIVAVLLDESTEYYNNATIVCVIVALAGHLFHYTVPHFADVHDFTRQITAAWPDISNAWSVVHRILKDLGEQLPGFKIHPSILKHENISDFIVEQVKKHAV